ncbi:YqeG family HAD IIIA-type phosphatase [Alteribacter lacisalsi]|uniref:YqeG family HAD IIIA-type phosphatase n=1 Tax=Alteribacter lacisalsi TaxID=2045244 RepID=A0A2W0HY47_9BACI|nr:YqeG family HAD IIIA-type phosphatase [Alteribacter lacisalsi]PYZ98718.1 YqeG family HAD IIIA-type phosphatase [Alteribacter lacisalsi]
MLKRFVPDQYVPSIFDISVEELKQQGIKGIITDLDNTLVEWDRPNATEELIEWFKMVKREGIDIVVVSNNTERRVKEFSDPHELTFIHSAKKPMTRAFKTACNIMKIKRSEAVVVGDQLLTDIFGGNRGGFHTILVVPVAKTDGVITKMNRRMERVVFRWMKRKGLIEWENKKKSSK